MSSTKSQVALATNIPTNLSSAASASTAAAAAAVVVVASANAAVASNTNTTTGSGVGQVLGAVTPSGRAGSPLSAGSTAAAAASSSVASNNCNNSSEECQTVAGGSANLGRQNSFGNRRVSSTKWQLTEKIILCSGHQLGVWVIFMVVP